ncbi:MAG TPA: M1 family metallopeptidase [Gemmatimonadales bacterium]|jgi:hypothetical protein
MLALALAFLQQPPLVSGSGPAPYWQQRVVYQISARLDEPTATLGGTEAVHYINHSPDTLHTISFHLYLNAFRPGSRWSAADAAERRHRFDTLKDPDFGFNHVRNVKIAGTAVTPIYPFGTDSTVVRFTLPHALAPGDSTDVTMDWDARPSIPPRRQGRRGRSYDFAQWYPKVVVYDKYGWEEHALYPAGEFYGEFGDFYVKLDVPKDQVVGATGVPVCGDPGWAAANRGASAVATGASGSDVRVIASAHTDPYTILSVSCSARVGSPSVARQDVGSNRKQLLWVARDVHNFAITMSPDYRYEGGEWNGIQVHVLYQPGDEKTWGGGIVVQNTIKMLQWMNFIFGKYPWPQMTVAHRIEGGGTEFPMMEMNGSPSLGLNLHEGGHSYLMGILANNEWREGWMDEGFTSFQTAWYNSIQARTDAAQRNLESAMLLSDLDGESQPVETVSEKFRDFNTYNNMIYNRGALFLDELHNMVGDSVMLEILHRYYARWALHHVDEDAFKAVVEEVTHRDMSTFFAQWLHSVTLTDYAIPRARRVRTDSGWQTRLTLKRRSPGIFPVTVAVFAAHDTAYVKTDGVDESRQMVIHTASRPDRVAVDPFEISHDWNMLNNQVYLNPWRRVLNGNIPTDYYVSDYANDRIARDRLTLGFAPALWYNDVGGVTLGLRSNSDYLGRFEQATTMESCSTGAGVDQPLRHKECDFTLSLVNPIWWRMANVTQRITAFRVEGRTGAGVSVERVEHPHQGFGPAYTTGISANWTATYDLAYLPPELWDNGGTGEGAVWAGIQDSRGGWQLGATARAAGGIMYGHPGDGVTAAHNYDAQSYVRPEITLTASRAMGHRTTLAVRGYAAGVFSADPVLSQRRIFVAGADPYATTFDPLLRSVGSPFNRTDCWCRWHTPGDGNLRAYDQALSTDRLATINAELQVRALTTRHHWLSAVGVVLFGDAGYLGEQRGIGGIGDSTAAGVVPDRWLADAGIGVRLTQQVGTLHWVTRIDVPFYASDPALAFAHRQQAVNPGRLLVSFSPVMP